MSNPYAPAKQNSPSVYDSAPTSTPGGPTPDPEENLPGEGTPDPVSPEPSPDPTAPPSEEPIGEEVPVGTIAEVTQWVGEDKNRAAQALEVEKNGANRKTLVSTLEGILSDS